MSMFFYKLCVAQEGYSAIQCTFYLNAPFFSYSVNLWVSLAITSL